MNHTRTDIDEADLADSQRPTALDSRAVAGSQPNASRRAVIDIGTNSVKLLVAEVDDASVRPLWERSEQTRLGQGFYSEHRLQPGPIGKTAQAVAQFAATAREWNVASTRVIATSAARDAVNQAELVDAVWAAAGLRVEVISGAQEADWAFAGVHSDPALAGQSLLIVDVGGGSSEFILGAGLHQDFSQSLPIGSVRLLEQMRPADPPLASDWQRCQSWLADFLSGKVKPFLQPRMDALAPTPVCLVGTGGTASILASMELRLTAFDRARLEQTSLSKARLWHFQELLWSLPLAERRKLDGLPANRADVILYGVAVFVLVMETFGFETLRVSTRGLRFAAAMARL